MGNNQKAEYVNPTDISGLRRSFNKIDEGLLLSSNKSLEAKLDMVVDYIEKLEDKINTMKLEICK